MDQSLEGINQLCPHKVRQAVPRLFIRANTVGRILDWPHTNLGDKYTTPPTVRKVRVRPDTLGVCTEKAGKHCMMMVSKVDVALLSYLVALARLDEWDRGVVHQVQGCFELLMICWRMIL